MNSTHDLSWNETSFRAKWQLFFETVCHSYYYTQFGQDHSKAEEYSSASSTYYSIAGTGFAQLKSVLQPFNLLGFISWCVTWLPLSGWCYWRMLHLSNCVTKIVSYDVMTAEQCDVRQSILRRRGQYDEALQCIISALTKSPKEAHLRGLFHAGLAEIYQNEHNYDYTRREIRFAESCAGLAEKENPQQAVRIYRACAKILSRLNWDGDTAHAGQLRDKAIHLAGSVGAKDQLLKLQ